METKINSPAARRIYTVSEITQGIKLILEGNFNDIWVEGEVSGFTRTPKGIIFFSLKDSSSLLKCVMFNPAAANLKFQIKDGMKLVCYGRVSVYEKDGRYQLYAQQVEPKGIGSLQLALEQLKEKLEKEGLFSPEHKRPIPYLPSRIGVVTSLSGAAIKDILKVLDRRFGDVHIIIKAAQVQGDAAKDDIARAIRDLNIFNETLPAKERIEVMIVGRGGGSIEDLWAFNEEIVARSIYNSRIPVISAVGHERDWTIADLVADLRAPTPSVAAELVVPKKEDLKERLDSFSVGLKRSFLDTLGNFQESVEGSSYRLRLSTLNLLKFNAGRFEAYQKRLALLNPAVIIQDYMEKIADSARQIYVRMQHFMEIRKAALISSTEKLSGLCPLNILNRGYSITFKMPGSAVIKDARLLKKGDIIKTRLHKGDIFSQVTEVEKNG